MYLSLEENRSIVDVGGVAAVAGGLEPVGMVHGCGRVLQGRLELTAAVGAGSLASAVVSPGRLA